MGNIKKIESVLKNVISIKISENSIVKNFFSTNDLITKPTKNKDKDIIIVSGKTYLLQAKVKGETDKIINIILLSLFDLLY